LDTLALQQDGDGGEGMTSNGSGGEGKTRGGAQGKGREEKKSMAGKGMEE